MNAVTRRIALVCGGIWASALFVIALTVPFATDQSSGVFDSEGHQETAATTTEIHVPLLAALLPLGLVWLTWLLLKYRIRWAALCLAAMLLVISVLGILTIGLYVFPLALALIVASIAPGPRRPAEAVR